MLIFSNNNYYVTYHNLLIILLSTKVLFDHKCDFSLYVLYLIIEPKIKHNYMTNSKNTHFTKLTSMSSGLSKFMKESRRIHKR